MMKTEKIKNSMMRMKLILFNTLKLWLKSKTKKRKIEKMKYGNISLTDTVKKSLKLCIKL